MVKLKDHIKVFSNILTDFEKSSTMYYRGLQIIAL